MKATIAIQQRAGCIKSTNYSLPRCTQSGRILYVLFYWVTLRSFYPLRFYVSYDFEGVRTFYQNYTCFPFKWNSSRTAQHLAKRLSIETEKIGWNARSCRLLERYSGNFLALFPDFCIIFEYFHLRPLHRRVIFFSQFLLLSFLYETFVSISKLFSGLQWQAFIIRTFVENFSIDIYLQFSQSPCKVNRYSNFLSQFCSLNFIFGFNSYHCNFTRRPSKQLVFISWKS